MKTLTIFTPTFNRKNLLKKCYQALLSQTNKDFIWLIIDDGSTDDTGLMVDEWIKKGEIDIEYIYQNNQGMHGAHNTAHLNAETPLTVCCDSDDYLAKNAVEIIINLWNEKGNESYAGIIGNDADVDGNRIVELPTGVKETTLYDLRYKFKIRGDFKLVYRTELLQEELYPLIDDEDYLAVGYKYFMIDQKYNLLITNETLCYVDYQDNGNSANKIKKYVTSPKGFMYYRLKMMPIMHNFSSRLWQATHYVSSSIFAREPKFLSMTENKWTVIAALPLGIVLNLYIRLKYFKNVRMN